MAPPGSRDDDGARSDLAGSETSTLGHPAAISDQAVPERIGPYRLLRVIGEGGMGIVYEAEQEVPVRRRLSASGGPPASPA